MKEIKSNYILKEISSYISEKKKLEIIIYNKQYQKRIEVNINDIKNQSKRYKIADKNGKGKEYKLNTDILLFKGEYKNWKRNGKGIEYFESWGIKYEVDYLNGKINGNKKEYY